MVIYGGWVCEGFDCRWLLSPRAEGFRDTVLGEGGSACNKGVSFVASLLDKILSSGCWAGGRRRSCGLWLLLILSIPRGMTNDNYSSVISLPLL